MIRPSTTTNWQNSLVLLTSTVVGMVAFAALYWLQIVFIPVAVAIFLTFLLSPLARILQRRGLGRVPSVLIVVFLASSTLGGLSWIMGRQVSNLLVELPQYTSNVKEKINSLRELFSGHTSMRLKWMYDEITGSNEPEPPMDGSVAPPEAKAPPPAKTLKTALPASEQMSWMPRVPFYLGSFLEAATGFGLVFVLLIFMLLNREDLRNRFIRLVGQGHLTSTTRAVDEAGGRITKYLIMQATVNGCYGVVLSIGLLLLGVDYAILWGFMAAFLRYVPYIGVWFAIVPPVALSLAKFTGWWHPMMVIGFFLVLELLVNNWIEPKVYGHSMGISETALLISAAFWAFLWGPVGLVLSAPLTVCLAVIGKYSPRLGFLDVILGDQPVLPPELAYYQRLLAKDQDEAAQVVLEEVKKSPVVEIYDDLLIPALSHARRDYEADDLSDADNDFICRATEEIMEDLNDQKPASENLNANPSSLEPIDVKSRYVLACPARDETDRLALAMLQKVLDPSRWKFEITAAETLAAELVSRLAEEKPAIICIGSVSPGGLAHTRYLCKRLRACDSNVRIIVGRWGLYNDIAHNREQLLEAGADIVTTSVLETRNEMNSQLAILAGNERKAKTGQAILASH